MKYFHASHKIWFSILLGSRFPCKVLRFLRHPYDDNKASDISRNKFVLAPDWFNLTILYSFINTQFNVFIVTTSNYEFSLVIAMFFFFCLLWELDEVSCLLDIALKVKGETLLLTTNERISLWHAYDPSNHFSKEHNKRVHNKMHFNWTISQLIQLLLKDRVIKWNLRN